MRSVPVWPDDGIKSCPNIATALFYLNVIFFKINQKVKRLFDYFGKSFRDQDQCDQIGQFLDFVVVEGELTDL